MITNTKKNAKFLLYEIGIYKTDQTKRIGKGTAQRYYRSKVFLKVSMDTMKKKLFEYDAIKLLSLIHIYTRLLAYLMMQLSCYNYIVYEWQSVIANNKLILKKIKGEPLTRTDLSSATDQAKNIYPKGYEIIDKFIKQLQKG